MAYDYGCTNGALSCCFFKGIIKFKQLKYIVL